VIYIADGLKKEIIMKITKQYLKQLIKEALLEIHPNPYDPVPPKHMRDFDGQKDPGYEDEYMRKKSDEEWLNLVANGYAQEPGNLEKIIASILLGIEKADYLEEIKEIITKWVSEEKYFFLFIYKWHLHEIKTLLETMY
jgi:hypothetical protein